MHRSLHRSEEGLGSLSQVGRPATRLDSPPPIFTDDELPPRTSSAAPFGSLDPNASRSRTKSARAPFSSSYRPTPYTRESATTSLIKPIDTVELLDQGTNLFYPHQDERDGEDGRGDDDDDVFTTSRSLHSRPSSPVPRVAALVTDFPSFSTSHSTSRPQPTSLSRSHNNSSRVASTAVSMRMEGRLPPPTTTIRGVTSKTSEASWSFPPQPPTPDVSCGRELTTAVADAAPARDASPFSRSCTPPPRRAFVLSRDEPTGEAPSPTANNGDSFVLERISPQPVAQQTTRAHLAVQECHSQPEEEQMMVEREDTMSPMPRPVLMPPSMPAFPALPASKREAAPQPPSPPPAVHDLLPAEDSDLLLPYSISSASMLMPASPPTSGHSGNVDAFATGGIFSALPSSMLLVEGETPSPLRRLLRADDSPANTATQVEVEVRRCCATAVDAHTSSIVSSPARPEESSTKKVDASITSTSPTQRVSDEVRELIVKAQEEVRRTRESLLSTISSYQSTHKRVAAEVVEEPKEEDALAKVRTTSPAALSTWTTAALRPALARHAAAIRRRLRGYDRHDCGVLSLEAVVKVVLFVVQDCGSSTTRTHANEDGSEPTPLRLVDQTPVRLAKGGGGGYLAAVSTPAMASTTAAESSEDVQRSFLFSYTPNVCSTERRRKRERGEDDEEAETLPSPTRTLERLMQRQEAREAEEATMRFYLCLLACFREVFGERYAWKHLGATNATRHDTPTDKKALNFFAGELGLPRTGASPATTPVESYFPRLRQHYQPTTPSSEGRLSRPPPLDVLVYYDVLADSLAEM